MLFGTTCSSRCFCIDVQELKRKLKGWAPLIELCASGEKTLERMRFQFPPDWLYFDQLNGDWNAFQEILKRKLDSIQEQLGIVCCVKLVDLGYLANEIRFISQLDSNSRLQPKTR